MSRGSLPIDLRLGLDELDEGHEQLFALGAALVEAAGSARSDRSLELLSRLGTYIARHFATEENLMRETAYPAMEEHLAEHRALQATYARVVAAFARYGDEARVADAVEAEIMGWLEHHVRTSDLALARHVKGVARDAA